MVSYLSLLLFLWHDRWMEIFAFVVESRGNNTAYISARPPFINWAQWSVRGIQQGDVTFVLEIKKTFTSEYIPFTVVRYIHQNFRSSGKKNSTTVSGQKRPRTRKSRIEDRSAKNPKNLGNPITIKFDTVEHVTGYSDELVKISYRTNGKSSKDNNRLQVVHEDDSTSEAISVSFNDRAGKGDVQSAEMTPHSLTSSLDAPVPFTLNSFVSALEYLADYYHSAMSLRTRTVGLSSSKRTCLVAEITKRDQTVYIVEVEPSLNKHMSTLVFRLCKPEENVSKALDSLLHCITASGAWNAKEVEQLNSIKVLWAKHTSDDADHWGDRLYEKVWMLLYESRSL
ncbi:MAG: hypothetical protein ACYCYO_22895 [Bacilli bacterium]